MILVPVTRGLEARAALFYPPGEGATVRLHQAPYIANAIAFGNNTRLGKRP